jgi:Rrf2 family protein
MARTANDRTLRKQDIADAEGISPNYVEQILIRLKAAGLVASFRGAGGGFALARPPATIRVGDVVRAMEGDIELAPCGNNECDRETVCVTRAVWQEAGRALQTVLDEKTIDGLAEEADRRQAAETLSFTI